MPVVLPCRKFTRTQPLAKAGAIREPISGVSMHNGAHGKG